MPELPEVEVYRRAVRDRVLRRRVSTVSVESPGILDDVSASTLRRHLKGAALVDTRRHGKHLFVAVARDGGEPHRWLRLHFGMTGEPVVWDGAWAAGGDGGGAGVREPPQTRLRLDFEGGRHLAIRNVRKLGRIGLVEDPDAWIAAKGLGPDPWRGFDEADLGARLRGRGGALKGALMDQEVVAGLGNVYVDEILFDARLDPSSATDALDPPHLRRLHASLHRVLELAVERGARPDAVPRTWLLRHREDGARCPRCGGRIEKTTMGGRSTYRCVVHQGTVG